MIAVDTSALMAIILREQAAEACMTALQAEDDLIASAATVAEALIVADRRNVRDEMERLIAGLGFRIVDVTPAVAHRVAQAYAMWGKGRHPAALNLGDCFAYDLAKDHGSRLLYTGNDFARTDIRAAL